MKLDRMFSKVRVGAEWLTRFERQALAAMRESVPRGEATPQGEAGACEEAGS